MNYACEITYPARESISGGIIMALSQLCGVGEAYLFDHFINHHKNKTWIINVIFLIFFVISFFFTLLLDEKLLRFEIDKESIKEKNNGFYTSQIEDNKKTIDFVEIKQK